MRERMFNISDIICNNVSRGNIYVRNIIIIPIGIK